MTGVRPRCSDCIADNFVCCAECAPWLARMLRAKAARIERERRELGVTLTEMMARQLRERADAICAEK